MKNPWPVLAAVAAAFTLWIAAPSAAAAADPVMVRQNLFSPERRPPSDANASAEALPGTPTPPVSVQLDAVFIYGDTKTALVRVNTRSYRGRSAKTSTPYVRVKENDLVEDYRVVSIQPKSIRLERNGETLDIPLFQEGKVSPPVQEIPEMPVAEPASAEPAAGDSAEAAPSGAPPQAGTAPAPGTPAPENQTPAQGKGSPAPASLPSEQAEPIPGERAEADNRLPAPFRQLRPPSLPRPAFVPARQ